MAFSDRLKESRTNANLTQEQLAEKLGIAKSTLSGYENGNWEPAISTIAKMLDILNVDANYLYQDEVQSLTDVVVDIAEKMILEKYRALDEHGKEMVDFTLEKEWERSKALEKQLSLYSQSLANAAHARTDISSPAGTDTSDDDIMDDDNF
ncbi:MAG: helix-turn-helix domain-containing protein [Lachnospiraceae bacterium]